MPRPRFTAFVLATLISLVAATASAESNDWVTLGVGAGMTVSAAPGPSQSTSTSFQFNTRLKFFKFLGVDLMVAPSAPDYVVGQPAPQMRLTALVYLVNFRPFAFFGAAGLAGQSFGDLVNYNSPSTHYRAGGGMEITFAGHYSLGLEGFWLVPGVGMVEQSVKSALDNGAEPSMQDVFPTDGWEMFAGFRYFF